MSKSDKTKSAILNVARKQFWAHGYSNVSLRDITSEVGVDVALVSRYFGSKLGLFQATLVDVYDWPELFESRNPDVAKVLIERLRDDETGQAVVQMLIANITDPEVGDMVQEDFTKRVVAPLETIVGSAWAKERVGMFLAAMIGMSMMRNSFGLTGISDVSDESYAQQLQHLARNALRYIA
ncbi:TetR/AcrR family transcriptional regulator [Paramylibacter kogurei]|nr:TetR/AcrR family transcriptional regulator [Amylibacter kogurei]